MQDFKTLLSFTMNLFSRTFSIKSENENEHEQIFSQVAHILYTLFLKHSTVFDAIPKKRCYKIKEIYNRVKSISQKSQCTLFHKGQNS